MNQIDLREGARRQHRATAVFAVIQCWLRNLDGLCFGRAQLERLLGLERFKQTRVEWLQEDLRDFFPYQETYWYKNDSFASLFVARRELKPHLAIGEMSDEERIKRVPENGPRLVLFRMWPRERHAERFETGAHVNGSPDHLEPRQKELDWSDIHSRHAVVECLH